MEVIPDQQFKRSIGLQAECAIGIIVVGILVITLGIVSASLLPICYMLYAQQTALGLLYTITGVISYAASPRSPNYSAKSAVAMALHVMTWVMTAYIFQVAMNLMAQSFHRDRSITPAECGYSSDSSDEVKYYAFGGISLLFAVAHIVLSIIVFIAFWKSGKLSPQMPVRYTVTQQPATYQIQAVGPVGGQNNGGYIQEAIPIQQQSMQVGPSYTVPQMETRPNPPPQYTPNVQRPQDQHKYTDGN